MLGFQIPNILWNLATSEIGHSLHVSGEGLEGENGPGKGPHSAPQKRVGEAACFPHAQRFRGEGGKEWSGKPGTALPQLAWLYSG